jgi:hypothetical protein
VTPQDALKMLRATAEHMMRGKREPPPTLLFPGPGDREGLVVLQVPIGHFDKNAWEYEVAKVMRQTPVEWFGFLLPSTQRTPAREELLFVGAMFRDGTEIGGQIPYKSKNGRLLRVEPFVASDSIAASPMFGNP